MDLWFDGISRPVRLEGRATDLIEPMRQIISTWPFREQAIPTSDQEPVIKIWSYQGDYSRASPWLNETKSYPDPVNAVCDFIVDLVHAYNAEHPEFLCLHCAAAIVNDQLVVFPSGYNQGKSTFMTMLASQQTRILCDDVMPLGLKTYQGQALGIQPRLRNPLPQELGEQFDDFVSHHVGPSSSRFQYLNLGKDTLANFGETHPVGGVVILERNELDQNTIEPAGQADALKAIILRNFAGAMPAASILDGLCNLIDQARIFRLNYSAGDAAIHLLRDAFTSEEGQ